MITPLAIATDGYLHCPLSVSANGYLICEVTTDGVTGGTTEYMPARGIFKKQLMQEDEEIMVILSAFMRII